jgi:hypothetical protein
MPIEVIHVEPAPILKSYDTADKAIMSGQRQNEAWLASSGAASLFNEVIQGAWWSAGEFWLRVSSGRAIQVRGAPNGSTCAVHAISPPVLYDVTTPVEFDFGRGRDLQDGEALIRKLVGKPLRYIQVSDGHVWLYVPRRCFCFGTVRNVESHELLLHWHEEE